MEHLHIIDWAMFIGGFLLATTLLQVLTKRFSFPYTVALLITGLLAQLLLSTFHIHVPIQLSPDLIYFVLLPCLLFEAAIRINLHQFKIQFKTITFFATFGLLLSVFVIGVGLALLLNLPFEIALLFGAIISATDPIAVLALFKSLGAPKRLALVADGESMFNDATGVIAFRIISSFVVADAAVKTGTILEGIGSFVYVFVGSIIVGVLLGILSSWLIQKIKQDRILVTALTTALAIGAFAGSEHFFHLSGVITTVVAGIVLGNINSGKLKSGTIHFLEEYWEYVGFLCLSVVFFFATYNLDLALFTQQIPMLFVVIGVVLVARSVSVYVSAFLSNRLPFFKNEPDIPMSWQHILNWGGLRGVIPLVLVYSLPDTFEYKDLMLRFTLATLLFTLFVNGLTIKSLLLKLQLHVKRKEEEIIEDEMHIFRIHESREKLHELPVREFDQHVIAGFDKKLASQETWFRNHLLTLSEPKEFLLSLKQQALQIERDTMKKLYDQGRFSETVLYEMDSELDLQQDALDYPEVYTARGMKRGGFIHTPSYRKKLIKFFRALAKHPFVGKYYGPSETELVSERYSLLRARLFTSYAVLDYLKRVEVLFTKKDFKTAIKEVRSIQQSYIDKNQEEVDQIKKKHPEVVEAYQKKVISSLVLE